MPAAASRRPPAAPPRFLGGDRIPEFYAKPSPYTEGTTFLGTPTNHEEVWRRDGSGAWQAGFQQGPAAQRGRLTCSGAGQRCACLGRSKLSPSL